MSVILSDTQQLAIRYIPNKPKEWYLHHAGYALGDFSVPRVENLTRKDLETFLGLNGSQLDMFLATSGFRLNRRDKIRLKGKQVLIVKQGREIQMITSCVSDEIQLYLSEVFGLYLVFVKHTLESGYDYNEIFTNPSTYRKALKNFWESDEFKHYVGLENLYYIELANFINVIGGFESSILVLVNSENPYKRGYTIDDTQVEAVSNLNIAIFNTQMMSLVIGNLIRSKGKVFADRLRNIFDNIDL